MPRPPSWASCAVTSGTAPGPCTCPVEPRTCATLSAAPPRAAEIADRLAITTGLVYEVQQANNARYATTLDRADGRRDESGDGFDAMLDRTVLAALLAHLAPRERRVLELRFFEELSQAEIAQRIGTSQVHVGRLIVASLAALRVLADEQHDDRRAA